MADRHDTAADEIAREWRVLDGRQRDILMIEIASALRQVERETLERTTYLRPEVFAFAERMERKLRENDHKGGWNGCGPVYLMRRLREETGELDRATCGSYGIDAERVGDEAADVANFAMMIADNAGALSPTESANELPTTQELADVSTPVELIDRDQSDGYVRVPREPTPETIDHMCDAWFETRPPVRSNWTIGDRMREVYRAMIKATPRVPRLKLTETDRSLDMHISNITRREAREIAEMLGGGAVVWHEDKCYPTTDVECAIQAAEKGE